MPILLFDGHCNLCNAWVNFIIKRDPPGRIRWTGIVFMTKKQAHGPTSRIDAEVRVGGWRSGKWGLWWGLEPEALGSYDVIEIAMHLRCSSGTAWSRDTYYRFIVATLYGMDLICLPEQCWDLQLIAADSPLPFYVFRLRPGSRFG